MFLLVTYFRFTSVIRAIVTDGGVPGLTPPAVYIINLLAKTQTRIDLLYYNTAPQVGYYKLNNPSFVALNPSQSFAYIADGNVIYGLNTDTGEMSREDDGLNTLNTISGITISSDSRKAYVNCASASASAGIGVYVVNLPVVIMSRSIVVNTHTNIVKLSPSDYAYGGVLLHVQCNSNIYGTLMDFILGWSSVDLSQKLFHYTDTIGVEDQITCTFDLSQSKYPELFITPPCIVFDIVKEFNIIGNNNFNSFYGVVDPRMDSQYTKKEETNNDR